MAKVKVNKPSRPKGSKVNIPNLGSFKNGEETEVPDDVWKRYQASNPAYKNKTVLEIPVPKAQRKKLDEENKKPEATDTDAAAKVKEGDK